MSKLFKYFVGVVVFLQVGLFAVDKSPNYPMDAFVGGHNVYVTKDSDDSTSWKYELLRNAKRSIEMAPGYVGGEVFRKVFDIFVEQLDKNPIINIYFIGVDYFGLLKEKDQADLKALAEKYPDRFHYQMVAMEGPIIQKGSIYTTEAHSKIIIADEKYFILGGTNLVDNLSTSVHLEEKNGMDLAEKFLPKAAQDMDAVVEGPMAKKMREEFFRFYQLYKTGASLQDKDGEYKPEVTEYYPIEDSEKGTIASLEENPDFVHNVGVYAMMTGPRMNQHEVGDLLTYFFKNAKLSIDLAQMYFFPVDRIMKELTSAASRNVEISVITNGLQFKPATSNSTVILYAYLNRLNYVPIMLGRTFNMFQKIVAKGTTPKKTTVYEYNREFVLYHKKVAVVDRRYSFIGSYNLGRKSEISDYEVEIIVDSPEVAQQFLVVLEEDKSNSVLVSLKDAIDYYFSLYYNSVNSMENVLFDGIIL